MILIVLQHKKQKMESCTIEIIWTRDKHCYNLDHIDLNLQDNSMPTIILFIQKFQIMLPGAYEFNISQQTEDALTYIMAE